MIHMYFGSAMCETFLCVFCVSQRFDTVISIVQIRKWVVSKRMRSGYVRKGMLGVWLPECRVCGDRTG